MLLILFFTEVGLELKQLPLLLLQLQLIPLNPDYLLQELQGHQADLLQIPLLQLQHIVSNFLK